MFVSLKALAVVGLMTLNSRTKEGRTLRHKIIRIKAGLY